MSLIDHYWARSECMFPGCTEPPDEGVMCLYHHDVRVSTYGSWVADRHGEAS